MSCPIPIREITIRECRKAADFRGMYTSGGRDPEQGVWLIVSVGDDKECGHGECIPTSLYYEPGHIGRSDIDEWAVLLDMAGDLIGRDARGLGRLLPDDVAAEDANSIRDALDFALHDFVGRRLGVPVAALLGGCARPNVWGIPVIHRDTPEVMAAKAEALHRQHGFMYFKLKPFGRREEDVELLTTMRAAMGPDVRYTMDANYRLQIEDPDEVVSYMEALHALGLEAYEDPLDTDFATLRAIRERTQVRIMIDDRARTPQAVWEIGRQQCADQINIHANWAGGFQPAIRKSWLAALGNMTTMVGSVRYLGPGAAAYITLASVLPEAAPCEQEFPEVFDRQSVLKEAYPLRDGQWHVPDKPGLGIDLDLDAVAAITVREETLQG